MHVVNKGSCMHTGPMAAACMWDQVRLVTGRQEEQAVAEEGRELIREVWGVVADYYLDARGGGFDQGKWSGLRDRYLAQPLPSHEAAYRRAFSRP